MKKKFTIVLSIILLIGIASLVIFGLNNTDEQQPNDLKEVTVEENEAISAANDEFIYSASIEEIKYDEDANVFFYENLLNVILTTEVSDEEAEELATGVDGEVVGKMDGMIPLLQIQVDGTSIEELRKHAETLENEELVKYANASIPSFVADIEKQEDANEDASHIQTDWWLDAIDAYRVWDYMDYYRDSFSPINVAVLEIGTLSDKNNQANDASLQKESIKMTSFSSKNAVYDTIKESDISHAELVTKVIAADPNKQTIRGVAEPMAQIKFTSIGSLSPEKMAENADIDDVKSISDTEVIQMIEASIAKEKAKVINNSWGVVPYSEARWKEDQFFSGFFNKNGYETYLDSIRNTNDQLAQLLIVAFDSVFMNYKDDFLIVQSAGNGKRRAKNEASNEQAAIDATYTGYFANINKRTYDEVADKVETSLEDIEDHIIIVGGAAPKENNKTYRSPAWTSYGEAIDIAAPASYLFNDGAYSLTECGDRDNKEVLDSTCGTSYAAPMVSGAAAVIWSYEPDLPASEVKKRLLENAIHDVVDEKNGKTYTYPLLNMTAFLNEAPYHTKLYDMYLEQYPVYKELIDTYRTAIVEQWDAEKLIEAEIGALYDHAEPVVFADYGYEFLDINKDGTPELIVGRHLDDGSTEVHEIYTIDNGKLVQLAVSGIRSNIHVYRDGTISESYGVRRMGYYTLTEEKTIEVTDGYEVNETGNYYRLTGDKELMTEVDMKNVDNEYKKIGSIDHTFTPFVLENVPEKRDDELLSDDHIKQIMTQSYREIEEILLQVYIGDVFNKHHQVEEAQAMWKSGVDPDSPFYQEVYELFYPEVRDHVSEAGMESLINEAFSIYWQPPAPVSFFGPEATLEVMSKDEHSFTIKQTKEVGPQEAGGESYEIVYLVKYVKENNQWKFAGVEKKK